MQIIKLQEKFIILLLILIFSYLIFKEFFNGFSIIEGNENKNVNKTPEEIEKEVTEKLPKIIEKIKKDCDENIFDAEKKFYCKRDGQTNFGIETLISPTRFADSNCALNLVSAFFFPSLLQ